MVKSTRRGSWDLFARVACILTITLGSPLAAVAATSFYVDPDWTGAATGAASSPWQSLGSAAWTTINNALSSGPVTVYFSAREAGADTNETTTAALNVYRTDTTSNRLTLDGNSKYNTNDGAPLWAAYSGTSHFQITAAYPVSTGTGERSNTTARGFRLIATNGQIVYWWGGHNVVLEDNELSSSPGATIGPGIYFGYTQQEGTTCPPVSAVSSCVRYTNLVIRRNYIHDTQGEGIYIGGCGNNTGCLAHDGVLIESNTLRNVAVYGGEPDAIDIKDGLHNVTVRGNDIRLQTQSRDGVTLESAAVVERNYVEAAGRNGITFSAYWNNANASRSGAVVRNNIIVNTGGNTGSGYSARSAIAVEYNGDGGDEYADAAIYSNTIYRVLSPAISGYGYGIAVSAIGTSVKNNIVQETEGVPLLVAPGRTLVTKDHNLWFKSGSSPIVVNYGGTIYTPGTILSFDSTSLSIDPKFVSQASPYMANNFRLQDTSTAIGAGNQVPTFLDDYFGTARGSTWDMGAIKYGTAPIAPTGLRILPQ